LLVDAGPFIALFDRSDQHHAQAKRRLNRLESALATTWPVITEVSHMLSFDVRAQLDFLRWIDLGGVTVYNLNREDLDEMIKLMTKYKDVPMDLADASLVALSNRLNTNRIFTIDSDFKIFKNRFKSYLVNEFEGED
jgi:predicted nucleic acid-binding protein